MKRSIILLLFFLFASTHILDARTITIKPYFGYTTVRMNEMNNDLKFRVNELSKLTQKNLPIPNEFNGNFAWGAQIQYRLEDNNFLNLNTFYFKEKNSAEDLQTFVGPEFDYLFSRQIELFEIGFGLHYFFNYSSWKPINTYIGGGAGIAFGWSESEVFYEDEENNLVNNRGEFSNNALSAHFAAGANVNILPAFFISGEIGYRFANLQNLNGKLQLEQNFTGESSENYTDNDFTTPAAYDFSGFYISVGTGIRIPFFD